MRAIGAVAFGAFIACSLVYAKPAPLSDSEIAKRIIAESIASYPGPCACPFNTARNGSSCGRRSAYSKPGGHSPICYREDVTPADINQYRKRLLQD